jgi:hypothetical protein
MAHWGLNGEFAFDAAVSQSPATSTMWGGAKMARSDIRRHCRLATLRRMGVHAGSMKRSRMSWPSSRKR